MYIAAFGLSSYQRSNMIKLNRNSAAVVVITLACCAGMAAFEILAAPVYLVKSAVKLTLFLVCPIIWARKVQYSGMKKLLIPSRRGLLVALLGGLTVFGVIIGAYFLIGGFFELSGITQTLAGNIGIRRENFIYVALYISFVNSLLEEFFFRGFAFLTLADTLTDTAAADNKTSRTSAGIFSAAAFSLYHISMMVGWFGLPLYSLILAALFIGGMIFNFFDAKSGNIYMSWMIHMFANFAINTIGLMLFAA